MTLLDKLKTIFETKFRDVFTNNNFKIFDFSRNETYVIESKDSNKLSIDLSKATDDEKIKIKELLRYQIQQKEEALLSLPSKELTHKISNNLPNVEDTGILEYYKGKLVPEMYNVLEQALILKRMAINGENISTFKLKIARQNPLFGNNMCNMVSQEYFHGHFKDLYSSMSSEKEFDIGKYQNKVLNIVISAPYTVFITRFKSYDELSREVSYKLERLRKYGAGKLLIHGLGKENVETTKIILDEYKSKNSIQIEIEPDSTSTMITAYLKF